MLSKLGSLNLQQIGALSVFGSYFALIGWLASVVFRSIQAASRGNSNNGAVKSTGKILLFSFLTLGSFMHTWFYMFKFMSWSFADYESHHTKLADTLLERVANWLVNTALFEQAWTLVSFGGMNWWWSEQLCLFTVGAWTVFLFDQGSRYKIKHVWAYTLLGQLVAISVASNLFVLAILVSQRPADEGTTKPQPNPNSHTRTRTLPPVLWISVLVAMVTVSLSPLTDSSSFLPNLLAMHALITIPLFFTSDPPTSLPLDANSVYLLVFLSSIPVRSRSILAALGSLPTLAASGQPDTTPLALFREAWKTLHWNPAQSSIGYDVVWTSVSFVAYVALTDPDLLNGRSRWYTVPYLVFATPFASVGVTAPYVLRPQLEEGEDDEGLKEE